MIVLSAVSIKKDEESIQHRLLAKASFENTELKLCRNFNCVGAQSLPVMPCTKSQACNSFLDVKVVMFKTFVANIVNGILRTLL